MDHIDHYMIIIPEIFNKGQTYEDYIVPSINYNHNKAQRFCKKPCLQTKVVVRRKGREKRLDKGKVLVSQNADHS